jgi:hypothetical protein
MTRQVLYLFIYNPEYHDAAEKLNKFDELILNYKLKWREITVLLV